MSNLAIVAAYAGVLTTVIGSLFLAEFVRVRREDRDRADAPPFCIDRSDTGSDASP